MKVAVYAICKNESAFAERWFRSMSEANEIYVLDTGSTDGSVEKLRSLGAHVSVENFTPFRFDVARNRSLELVPADVDVCVCTDLDEVFCAGWREKLEAVWREGVTRLRYRYVWSFNPDGSDGVTFLGDKIHARNLYRWKHPVHEVLVPLAGVAETYAVDGELRLEHYPDNKKSRSNYLPLLELSVAEDPTDDRNMHYLGREYMFHKEWQKAITTLRRHLELPTATWIDERAASMRYIARCYRNLLDRKEAESWLLRACAEAPHLREPFCDLADFYYDTGDDVGLYFAATRATRITERTLSYINDPAAWSERPFDLLSIACHRLGLYREALTAARTAQSLAPLDPRIAANVKYFESAVEGKQEK